MKKLKRGLALILAIALVMSNGIYSMSSSLQANQMDASQFETAEAPVEETVEPEINTEGVDVNVPEQVAPVTPEQPTPEPAAPTPAAPEQTTPEQTTPEPAAPEQPVENKFNVIVNKPTVEGGVLRVWTTGDKTDVTYDENKQYKQEITEGTLFSLEITAKENYEVEKVTDQSGNVIKEKTVNEKVYTYEFPNLNSETEIHVTYKEITKNEEAKQPEEEKKPEENKTEMPAQTLNGEAGKVTVKVDAPEGALPEGTTLNAKKVSATDVEAALESQVEADGKQLSDVDAVEVTLQDKDGNTIQPKEDVTVTLDGIKTSDTATEAGIYFVGSDNTSAKIVEADAKEGTVEFQTRQISMFAKAMMTTVEETTTKGTPAPSDYQVGVGEVIDMSVIAPKYASVWWQVSKNPDVVQIDGESSQAIWDSSLPSDSGKATMKIKGLKKGLAQINIQYFETSGVLQARFLTINVGETEGTNATITFKPNGADGEIVSYELLCDIDGKVKMTLPNPSDIEMTHPKGYMFAGWSKSHNGKWNNYVDQIQYTFDGPTTMYAIWLDPNASAGVGASFYVRNDGQVPYEPSEYNGLLFSPDSGSMPNGDKPYFLGKLKAPIAVNNNPEAVKANLQEAPSDEKLVSTLAAYGVNFDPDTQVVEWYVIKSNTNPPEGLEGTEWWHVDGVIKNKSQFSVGYLSNGGNGNFPSKKQHTAGDEVTVDFNTIPERAGYTFLGWDENKDAQAATYTKGGINKFTMPSKNVDLYAIWTAKSGIEFTVKHYTGSGDNYDTYSHHSDSKPKGVTGEGITSANYQITIDGYKLVKAVPTSVIIQGDGSTVIKLYYKSLPASRIQFVTNGGTTQPDEIVGVAGESVTGTMPTGVEKTGYTFAGWYDNEELQGNALATLPETFPEGTTIYYAKWIRDLGEFTLESYEDKYDGAHHGVKKNGTILADEKWQYSTDGITWSDQEITYKDFTNGSKTVHVRVVKNVTNNLVWQGATSTVTITKRNVIMTSGDGIKQYDGTPLVNQDVTIGGDKFVRGEIGSVGASGTATNVTDVPVKNIITVIFRDGVNENNYNLNTKEGNLTITPRAITITAESDSKVYDGKALIKSDYKITSGEVVVGETLTTTIEGSQTEVGFSNNVAKNTKITKADQSDSTKNYAITELPGTLTVTDSEEELVLSAVGGSKTYDGTPLEGTFVYDETKLAEGEYIEAVLTGSKTNVEGTAKTEIASYNIYDKDGTDITAKYPKVIRTEGDLVITARPLSIKANDGNKTYNGLPLTADGYTVVGELPENKPAEGEEIASVKVTGSITEAGTEPNVASKAVIKRGDIDVSANYAINYIQGTLTITAKTETIQITANTKNKPYDGTYLTAADAGYTFTKDILVEGDRLVVELEGRVGTVIRGAVEATVASYKVLRGETDVTDSYTFAEPIKGSLSITKRPVTLTSGSDDKVYDGAALTKDEVKVTSGSFVVGEEPTRYDVTGTQTDAGDSPNTFTTVHSGQIDLQNYAITETQGKLEVFPITSQIFVTAEDANKDYDGSALTKATYTHTDGVLLTGDVLTATVEGSITDSGSTPNRVTGHKIMRGETNVTKNYSEVTYADGTLRVDPREVTLTSQGADKEYDGTALTNDKVVAVGFIGQQGATYKVTGSQTNEGKSSNTFTYELKEGTNEDNYAVTKVEEDLVVTAYTQTVTIKAGNDSKTYDGTPLTTDEFTVTGLADGDKVIATVTGSQTDAETGTSTIASYKIVSKADESIDRTGNYSPAQLETGNLVVGKKAASITTPGDSKVYNGTPLTKTDGVVVEGFVKEEGVTVTVTGSQTDKGKSDNTFTTEPNEGTTLGNYNITETKGPLEVTARPLTIRAASDSRAYNGTPLTANRYDIPEESKTSLAGGDEITGITITGSQLLKGNSPNVAKDTVITRDVEGRTQTVTGNYDITYVDGELTITAKEGSILITPNSSSKPYDGTPLKASDVKYTYTAGILESGDALEVIMDGEVTNVSEGSVAAKVKSYKVVRDGADVTDNYNFEPSKEGTLSITAIDITLTSASDEKIYDGTPLTKKEVSVTSGTFIGKEAPTYTITGTRTDAGSNANTFTYEFGQNVEKENYNINKVEGTLEVEKKAVTITVDSANKVYGTREPDFSGTVEGLVGENDLGNITYSRTEGEKVGKYPEAINPTFTENGNYAVTVVPGNFEIFGMVSYDANGATSGTLPTDESQYALGDNVITATTVDLKRGNAVFLGWSLTRVGLITTQEQEDIALAGRIDSIAMGEKNMVFYAIWAEDRKGPAEGPDEVPDYKEFEVVYNRNHNDTDNVNVKDNNLYPEDYDYVVGENPFSRPGYVFVGWNTGRGGNETALNPKDKMQMKGNTTLYAQWEVDEIGEGENPDRGDEIPDRYQAIVTFVAVNGTVSFDRTVVTLRDAQGNPSETGVGSLSRVATASAGAGYVQSSLVWTPEAPQIGTTIREARTFTATFATAPVVTPDPTTPTPTTTTPAAVTPTTVVQTILQPVTALAEQIGDATTARVEELVPVDDEGVPLANRSSNDHKCCILHFLLMLLALVIEIFYTRSMKKRQQKIFELEEELAMVEKEEELSKTKENIA